MLQIKSYTENKKAFLLSHAIFAVILFCLTFVSCLMDIRFVIASPLIHVGHLLYKELTGVEMYSVTLMRNVTEICKRSKSVLHSFHIRWTFVLRWIL